MCRSVKTALFYLHIRKGWVEGLSKEGKIRLKWSILCGQGWIPTEHLHKCGEMVLTPSSWGELLRHRRRDKWPPCKNQTPIRCFDSSQKITKVFSCSVSSIHSFRILSSSDKHGKKTSFALTMGTHKSTSCSVLHVVDQA